jgi:hypothetical protein
MAADEVTAPGGGTKDSPGAADQAAVKPDAPPAKPKASDLLKERAAAARLSRSRSTALSPQAAMPQKVRDGGQTPAEPVAPAKPAASANPTALTEPAAPAARAPRRAVKDRSVGERPAAPPLARGRRNAASKGATQARRTRPSDILEPVVPIAKDTAKAGSWTEYLVLFLRVMAAVTLMEGLYHWTALCGIGAPTGAGFEAHTIAWRAATVFFAVIDLVAGVGLWLAAAWGAVVWLTAVVSMAVVEVFFPLVYGGSIYIVLVELMLVAVYLTLAIVAARERPA